MSKNIYTMTVIAAWRYVGQTIVIVLLLATVAGFIVSYPVLQLKEQGKIIACILSFIAAGLTIGIFSSLKNYRKFVKPINAISEFSFRLYNKDLTGKMNLKNAKGQKAICMQLSEAQENLAETLRNIIEVSGQMREQSHRLDTSCNEMAGTSEGTANGINDVSRKMSDQSENISSALSSANAMRENINKLLSDFGDIYASTMEANKISELGSSQMTELKSKTEENREAMKSVNQVINELDNKTKDITAITDVIISIAEQTNLLALNAAIEAARAGEAGKGFSVVADEIRQLAEQSQGSVKRIMAIIREIQSETKRTIEAIENISSTIVSQNNAIESTGKSFEDISVSVSKITAGSSDIKAFMDELAENNNSFVKSLGEIADIAQNTSAYTQEITAYSEEQNGAIQNISEVAASMSSIADSLGTSLERFKLQ